MTREELGAFLQRERMRGKLFEIKLRGLELEQRFMETASPEEWREYVLFKKELEKRYNHNHDPKTGRFASKSGLTNAAASDNMTYKDGSYDFHPVSDKALNSKSQCDCFEDDQLNDAVNEEMHNILNEAKKHIPGTEIGKTICIEDYTASPFIIGGEGEGAIDIPKADKPYISIHNHASGETLSSDDLSSLLSHGKEQGAFVIGNNGNIYGIIKAKEFDWISFQRVCIDKTYDDVIRELIEGRDDYGLRYYERIFR